MLSFLITLLCISALFVLISQNHVHSVMFLIAVFIIGATILLIYGIEFIAFIFIIVYVGAIAVLFLFIVMMLDIKKNENSLKKYIPFFILFTTTTIISITTLNTQDIYSIKITNLYLKIDNLSNIEIIGQYLFNEFLICFLLCGILLLIAMLGAIILTQNFARKKTNEIVTRQLSRNHYPYNLHD